MIKFKEWLNENQEHENQCFRIIRLYFYNMERNQTKENRIMNDINFPIHPNEHNKLNSLLNILVENVKYLNESKQDYLLTVINKYFDSLNDREIMFNFIRNREPRLDRYNVDLESKQFAIDFHARFAKS